MTDLKAGKSLLLVDVLRPNAVAHINGWNVAQSDLSVEFIIDQSILEDMQNSSGLTDTDYETRGRIMDKLRR